MRQRMLRAADAMPEELGEQLEGPPRRERARHSAKVKRKKRPASRAPERQPQPAAGTGQRPVHSFRERMIETSIWLNPSANPLDPPGWRVTQRRFVPTADGIVYARSLRPEDLDTARWGLYQARRWVKKAERQAIFRSLFAR